MCEMKELCRNSFFFFFMTSEMLLSQKAILIGLPIFTEQRFYKNAIRV